MEIRTEMGSVPIRPDNAIILTYPNDMMNGMFVDMDEQYCFIQADSDAYEDILEKAREEGIPEAEVGDQADLTEYPHCYVIQSLARFVMDAAEESLNGE